MNVIFKIRIGIIGTFMMSFMMFHSANAQLQQMELQNEPVDISKDFYNFTNTYYFADSLGNFDPNTSHGQLKYRRHEYSTRMAFYNMLGSLKLVLPNEFPAAEYVVSPSLPFSVDFGEVAPANGIYHSGRTGFFEHNLFSLRYNKAVADITLKTSNEQIIWARSAWAGSQCYPVHWGGNAANTNNAMQSQLRGGLSLGLSGFSFWSHDIGGFVVKTPEDLYLRWLPFGMLTSQSRCHGMSPKELW